MNQFSGLDTVRLKQLCPLITDEIWEDIKYASDTKFKDDFPHAYFWLESVLKVPFQDLPLHLNDQAYSGLARGIVIYRLEIGK